MIVKKASLINSILCVSRGYVETTTEQVMWQGRTPKGGYS